jgi:hypothetical protein
MTLYHVFDAAYPPTVPKVGMDGVLGYIGGDNALNVWTPAQWLPFRDLRQFPVWVPDPHGKSTPAQIGAMAVDRANELGWVSSNGSRVIVIDLEEFADRAWWLECGTAINQGGYYAVCYGNASTVAGNHATNVWAAQYDNSATLPAGWVGKQYAANLPFLTTKVDYSVVSEWLFLRGGVGPRHGAAK